MSIKGQFNTISKEYDANRRKFIPCFDEYYGKATDFIAANIDCPERVLDLGAGTGLLTYYWYRHFESAAYTLVDLADEMLNVARERFSGAENITFELLDYSQKFPRGEFDCIISALSIHHLENDEKQKLFSRIYSELPTGGLFVNYDQFRGGSPQMDLWFDTYWVNQLENSGLTPKDIERWKERRKLDREISVETEVQMLKRCKFKEVKCIYSNQKFAVIVACK